MTTFFEMIRSTQPCIKSASVDSTHSIIKADAKPIENTIGYVLSQNARVNPYANALKTPHQHFTWSFNTLKRHVEAFACGVVEIGLRPGDRLGLIQGANAENVCFTCTTTPTTTTAQQHDEREREQQQQQQQRLRDTRASCDFE